MGLVLVMAVCSSLACSSQVKPASEATAEAEREDEGWEGDEFIDDERLRRFAVAVISLYEMDNERDIPAEFDEAESRSEAVEVREELLYEMERRIEEAGLGFEEYMLIRERVEADPELQKRLAEIIEAKGAGELIRKR